MRIDLHAHSAVSDGTDRPRDLVLAARAAGLDVLALTDHDTTDGWDDAIDAADEAGLRLICGIEVSTRNVTYDAAGNATEQGQHLLAYSPSPHHPDLTAMLAAAAESRTNRTPLILAKITEAGYEIDPAAISRFAGGGVVGKPHIADALVEAGICRNRDDAFARFLKRGGLAYVGRFQPRIEDAITVIRAAGGVPVVAHPWGRKTHVSEERFAELAALGLAGIEVDHQEHDATSRDALRGIAANLDLAVTGSSDHHGTGKINHDLGCNTTHPEEFARLMNAVRSPQR